MDTEERSVSHGRPKLILSIVGVVVVVGLVVGLTRGDDASSTKLVMGGPPLEGTSPVAKVSGPALAGGKTIDVAAFKGKKVILNAWASWCGPCRDEAPDILRFTKEHPDVVFLGVNVNDDRSNATKFNAEVGWTHASIYDPNGTVGLDTLKVTTLPATIYVDSKGIERGRTQGAVTYEDLVSAKQRLP
jgi:thiol-disulfide isomerase/thioredoxin